MNFPIRKLLLALALLPLGLCAFGQVKDRAFKAMLKSLLSHSVPELTVQEAVSTKMAPVWLDAREPKEYAVSHLAGAVCVGYDHPDWNAIAQIPKDQPIIVYCSVGYRSEKIAEQLLQKGYSRVFNLYGGIFEWVNEGWPVQDAAGRTNKVHAFDQKWGVWLRKGEKVY